MLFVTLSYAWKKWEGGQVSYLSGNQPSEPRSPKECEILAGKIVHHIETFDHNCKGYFIAFVIAELLNAIAYGAILAYYYFILEVNNSDIQSLVLNHFRPKYNEGINSPVFNIFPREIICLLSEYGPSGPSQLTDYKCTALNVYVIELFHIVSIVVSAIVVTVYFMNLIYIIQHFLEFENLAPINSANLPKSNKYLFAGITIRKKLLIMLLYYNLDYSTHNKIMQKLANVNPFTVNVTK